MTEIAQDNLWKLLRRNLPRLLSQLNRDKDSPLFGSFDRNFWHYKIRDFSSMILQQGMLVLLSLKNTRLPDNPFYGHPLMDEWIDGSLRFWAGQQLRNGSFNEYYPFEEGYPPTAFSMYAVGLVFKSRQYPEPSPELKRAIQKTCNWLLKNPEKEALNQEAAGLAGLVLASKIPGIIVDEKKLEKRLSAFYSAQSSEGWFPEYHGPDTGYLSVTIDCLWDIYETISDSRAMKAMKQAVEYISAMVSVAGTTPVMINSRNTDYIVLYGLSRLAAEYPKAGSIIQKLLEHSDNPDHYLNRTDDRYISHYVYQSCFRSLEYLPDIIAGEYILPCEKNEKRYFEQAGIYYEHRAGKSIFVNARKGGIINLIAKDGPLAVDFGWRSKLAENKVALTHWQDNSYHIEFRDENSLLISGNMTKHSWMKPSPFKHIGLRLISFLMGKRLIPILKKLMIFGDKQTGIAFSREIIIEKDKIRIQDEFSGKDLSALELYRAPHYSLRHVSSAGLFVPEELLPLEGADPAMADGKLIAVREILLSAE